MKNSKLQRSLQKASITFSKDGLLRVGDHIMLFNLQTKGILGMYSVLIQLTIFGSNLITTKKPTVSPPLPEPNPAPDLFSFFRGVLFLILDPPMNTTKTNSSDTDKKSSYKPTPD